MKTPAVRLTLNRIAASLLMIVALAASQSPADAQGERPLELDSFLSDQSLIGTSPEQYAWSRDGRHMAFVWNDTGHAFRDVWVYSVQNRTKRRLTNHGKEASPQSRKPGVSEVAWLPGERVAYVLDGRLHVVDANGASRPLGEQSGVRGLQISPDGRHLSFVTGGADSSYQHTFEGVAALWVRSSNPEQNDARQLVADDASRTFIESHEWSQDSSRIAFVVADNSDVPQRKVHFDADGEAQVYEVTRAFPGDNTTRRRVGVANVSSDGVQWLKLPDDRHPIWGYGLSKNGKSLFVNSSNYIVKEHTIYLFDVTSGEREIFYQHADPQNVIPGWEVAWAPQDNGLIILTDRDGFYHLHHQAKAGGELRALTRGEWEIESFKVDAKNRQIYFIANESHMSERQIYRVPAAGGKIDRITRQAGTHTPVFSPDFRYAAVNFSSDDTPPDLYLQDLRSKASVQITDSPRADFETYAWGSTRYVEFKSHVDGATLFGRLSVPADFDPRKRYPLIVGSVYADTVRNLWGRGTRPAWGLDHHLNGQGYLVLKVNVRGSWGQGKAFSSGLIRDYGGIDTDDIESGVRHLIAQGYVDPERVGIWGSSYGGLMTLMSLFKKPGLYAAGIAGAPATNVSHAYPSQMWVMGEPKGDDFPARYERQSALYQSAGLEDPLMIIHGTRDVVVLYSDTIALVERLMDQDKLFELVTLPGANHGWDSDSLVQTRFAYKKMIDFFDRHLKPAETGAE